MKDSIEFLKNKRTFRMGKALTIIYKIISQCFQIDDKYRKTPKTTALVSAVMEKTTFC